MSVWLSVGPNDARKMAGWMLAIHSGGPKSDVETKGDIEKPQTCLMPLDGAY